jgi:hypothetical protein
MIFIVKRFPVRADRDDEIMNNLLAQVIPLFRIDVR